MYALFLEAWNKAVKVEFNPQWKNSTGYLDHLTYDENLDIPVGSFAATTDDYGRFVLIKKVSVNSNIVVFERHVHGLSEVLVNNQPSRRYLKSIGFSDYVGIPDGQLNKRSLEIFLGLRENKFILNSENIAYLQKNMPEELSTETLNDFINRGISEGVSELELLKLGYDYTTFLVYNYGLKFI